MLILGFDTATPVTAIGVSQNGDVLASKSFLSDKTQTEQLMPAVDSILKETGLKIRDVEGLAVGLGPGLFTSSRIGVITAKSLAYALRVPLVGICTLDAVALGASHLAGRIVAVIDARRKEVFAAAYEISGGKLVRMTEPDVMPPEALADLLKNVKKPAVLAGNGTTVYRDRIEFVLPEGWDIGPEETAFPDAGYLLRLATDRLGSGEADRPETVVPIYIRHADAETYTGKTG